MRPRISPASRRCTASGLIRMRLPWRAMAAPGPCTPRPPSAERRRGSRLRGLDRRFAVRADLPDRVERRPAAHARLLELRGAHGTDEIAGVDLGVADGAAVVGRREAILDRLDLELALAHVLEVFGRPEEHVDERPEVRDHQRDEHRQADEERILHPAFRVLVRPETETEPEDDGEEEQAIEDAVRGTGADAAGHRHETAAIRYRE